MSKMYKGIDVGFRSIKAIGLIALLKISQRVPFYQLKPYWLKLGGYLALQLTKHCVIIYKGLLFRIKEREPPWKAFKIRRAKS